MLLAIGAVMLIGCILVGYGLTVERARRGLIAWGWREPPDAATSHLALGAGALLLIAGLVTMCVLQILLGLLSALLAYVAVSLSTLVLTLLAAKRGTGRRRSDVERRTD